MKRILAFLILLVFSMPVFAEQLTPEQEAEDKTVLYIVKEVNKQIPRETIVTSETVKIIGNQIGKIIIKAGYSKEEYSIRTAFCPVGHIHYRVIINSKTQNGQYKLEAKYDYEFHRIKT